MPRVGIHDMLHHETVCANGPYKIPEFAAAECAAAYRLSGRADDPRRERSTPGAVASTQFTVALQDTTTSGQPIILLTRMNAGHDIGSPFSQRRRCRDRTDVLRP
jgi:prolyl oligopeptidase